MKKISILGCIAAALLSLAGCEQAGSGGYDGINYIYLESDKTSMFEIDNEPIVVEVMLTKSLDKDVELTFALSDDSGIVRMEDNPVRIPAGKKTGYLKIYPGSGSLAESTNYTVALDPSAPLSSGLTLKEPFTFTLVPVNVEPLTAEQNAIIASYKAATGIDLAQFMGIVNVSVEYTAFDFTKEELLQPVTFTGKTLITLSDNATAAAPVIRMAANPMGIQDKMYSLLRALTVEYTNYWCVEEFFPDNVNLMNTIGWNADSKETFSMSLDGITFDAEGKIGFVGTGADQYGDDIVIVPFSYEFSAYTRELAAIADGTFVKKDEYSFDCTANPAYHLNNSDISVDAYEEENYTEASAVIDAKGNLVFTFCMATAMDSDYTKVIATYTPNN